MLFDYITFLEELKENENPEKRKVFERWEKFSSAKCVEDEPFYTYLNKFKVEDIPYKVPEELSGDFDWELLFKLVAGSFSSDYQLIYPNLDDTGDALSEKKLLELSISVRSGDVSVAKTISEIWSWQIIRLFMIYLTEQINLQALKCEDENEENAIDMERELQLKKFNHCKTAYLKFKYDSEQKSIRQRIFDDL